MISEGDLWGRLKEISGGDQVMEITEISRAQKISQGDWGAEGDILAQLKLPIHRYVNFLVL